MKKMSKGMLMTALICGAVYMGATPVYANDVQEFTLDEYVVTAARTETKLVDTPANISVVDAKTIEERHYQDVSEVLKDVPGANVIDTGTGAYEKKVTLNGDERVLILVDGRRMNFDMGTMTRSGYDMSQLPDASLIERIEVLKGAGGALYGSDAVGGVINIITKKADRNFGKVSIGYGSMGAKDYGAMYSIKEGKTGVSVSASKYKQDYYKYKDVKSQNTTRWPIASSYENEKVSMKLNQEINDSSNLEVGYDYSNFEGKNPATAQAYYANNLDKKTENLYAKYDWALSNNDKGYLQVYHNELEYDNVGIDPYDPSWSSFGFMKEKTNGVDLQQEFTVSSDNKIVVGASYRKSDVNTKGDNNYDESINNLAVFVNNTWEFAPTWTLNVGARYDNHSEAGNETTLSSGLNKKFNDDSHAYINWGQVFRAPTTDDLFYDSWMGKGNRDLKHETGNTWTIGYNQRLNNKTDFGINYFENDLKDAIDWQTTVDDNGTPNDYYDDIYDSKVNNVSRQKKRGMELTINHKLNENTDLIASYTYIRVKNNEGMGFIRDWNYMPNTYRLGINYHDGKWISNVWLRAGSGCDTVHAGYNSGYVENSFVTVDMSITYKATKDLSFYAKGYNLFNEAYAEQAGVSSGSYMYPAQSRRFIVGAEYKF